MVNLLTSHYMHILPLIAAAAIVYGGTRDERPVPILLHIFRAGLWMGIFLTVIMLVLLAVNRWLV